MVHFNKGRFGYSSRLFPQRTFPLGENTLQLTGPSGSPDLLLQFLLWGEVGGSRWLHCVLVAPSKQPWLLAAIPELQASALVCFPTGSGVNADMASQRVPPSANHSMSVCEAISGMDQLPRDSETTFSFVCSFLNGTSSYMKVYKTPKTMWRKKLDNSNPQ